MVKRWLYKIVRKLIKQSYPEIQILHKDLDWSMIMNNSDNNEIHESVKLYPPFHIDNTKIGRYSYVSMNPYISMTTIGQFCSIGPNFVCGWGIHPTDGVSTSPMFYSTKKQNGVSLCDKDKIEERKPVVIGNDVFIGANVTVLDGVTIGNGAVIGAGAVVSKDIPPYAIAVGCPIKVVNYRFTDEQVEALNRIEWWNYDDDQLRLVEKYFFDVEKFIAATKS